MKDALVFFPGLLLFTIFVSLAVNNQEFKSIGVLFAGFIFGMTYVLKPKDK